MFGMKLAKTRLKLVTYSLPKRWNLFTNHEISLWIFRSFIAFLLHHFFSKWQSASNYFCCYQSLLHSPPHQNLAAIFQSLENFTTSWFIDFNCILQTLWLNAFAVFLNLNFSTISTPLKIFISLYRMVGEFIFYASISCEHCFFLLAFTSLLFYNLS